MGIFDKLRDAILHRGSSAPHGGTSGARPASTTGPAQTSGGAARPAAGSGTPAPGRAGAAGPATSGPPPAASATAQPVDVEAVLEGLAAKSPQKLNWRTSIVDLMKLVELDPSLANRKELAHELGYTGDTSDSAAMNIWLHKQVMRKLEENGGKVPRACATESPRGSGARRAAGAHCQPMNFCSSCGARVALRVPPGDHLPRFICEACGTVHYQNPRIIAGCVPVHDERLLLCRRAIEPRRGFWTIPAGFMENEETVEHAAMRECLEEALATVRIGSLLAVVSVLHAHQVHIFFRASLASPSFGAGPESLEVELVRPEEIPWQDIAFPSTEFALKRYLADRAAGVERYHFTDFDRRRSPWHNAQRTTPAAAGGIPGEIE